MLFRVGLGSGYFWTVLGLDRVMVNGALGDRLDKIISWVKVLGGMVGLMVLVGCMTSSQPASPSVVCHAVTEALLGFELPVLEKMAISEQEIRGERVVTHLRFARPADNYPVKVVCVFAIDKYAQQSVQQGAKHIYSAVPTRMAVNSKQVTEADLTKAIAKAGL